MDIKNIKTFIRVAELGNFTRAASELGYVQSTVTAQIQHLENELGTHLFRRNGKLVTLSASGEEFLSYAYQIVKYETMAIEHFSSPQEPAGELKIGIMETIASSSYSQVFRRFLDVYPQVSLNLPIVTTHQALELLDKKVLDIIFLLDRHTSRPGFTTFCEYPVSIRFFCSPKHPFASRSAVTLEELTQESFLLTERGCNYREAFETELEQRGQTLRCRTEIGHTPYLLQAVSEGQGIGLLPSTCLCEALSQKKITLITVSDFQLEMYIQVIYHGKNLRPRLIHSFLRFLEESGFPAPPNAFPAGEPADGFNK